MTITISVTKADISQGGRAMCKLCPIARAVRRIEGLESAEISSTSLWPGRKATDMPIPLPEIARNFILRFDNCKPVEPFTFVMEIPD